MKINEIQNEGTRAKIQDVIDIYEERRKNLAERQFKRIMDKFEAFLDSYRKNIEENGVANYQDRKIRFSTPLYEEEEYRLLPEVKEKLQECGFDIQLTEVSIIIEW